MASAAASIYHDHHPIQWVSRPVSKAYGLRAYYLVAAANIGRRRRNTAPRTRKKKKGKVSFRVDVDGDIERAADVSLIESLLRSKETRRLFCL